MIKEMLMERMGRHWKLYISTETLMKKNNLSEIIILETEKVKDLKKISIEHEKKIIVDD